MSITIARRRLAYETWYFVHLYAYLGVVLAFSHQIALAQRVEHVGGTGEFVHEGGAATRIGPRRRANKWANRRKGAAVGTASNGNSASCRARGLPWT